MMSYVMYMLFLILFVGYINWYMYMYSFMLFLFFYLHSNCLNYYSNLSYSMGGDFISFSLVILTIWISFLMILSSHFVKFMNVNVGEFLFVISFLLFVLFLSFSVFNLMMYYIFFEFSLILTLILIFGWGYQPERLISGYYLLFYTMFFSFPMFLGIFYINYFSFSMYYFLIEVDFNIYLSLSMVMAFLVSMPLFFVHFWLPKAHVEAPISGSMILAGILLKLGGYGLMRVMNFINIYFDYVFSCLGLYSVFVIGLLCLFQIDIKSLIAYSSISHMGLVVCGLMSFNSWGYMGSIVLMMGHGLCSSGMFCLANINYERTGSRSLIINSGVMVYMPTISMFWFLFMVNNMASPPSLNLLGEIMLINCIVSWSWVSMFYLMFSSFFGCLYSIYLFGSLNHGILFSGFGSSGNGFYLEYLLLFLHWLPLNILFLKMDMFSFF